MPPTVPEPDALDQIMLLSTGSGVAQPLSPPPTGCQAPRNLSAAKTAATRVARAPIRRIVLLVAVDEIRNSVIDCYVIHLRDRS